MPSPSRHQGRDLDPIARRLSSLREGFHADSVALAREYREARARVCGG